MLNRQKFSILIISTLISYASPSLAASRKSKKHRKSKSHPTTDAKGEASKDANAGEEAAPTEENSSTRRVGKKFLVVGEIALVNILHSGIGAEAGYYLNPKSLIEVGVMKATFEFLGFKSEYLLLTAEYHRFVANSFYYFAGTGFSTLTSRHTGITLASGSFDTYQSTQSSTSLIAQGGIGNRWQFTSLTLGCDWVAYAKPLFQISSSGTYDEAASDEDRAYDKSSFTSQASNGILTNVRFHIGVSF